MPLQDARNEYPVASRMVIKAALGLEPDLAIARYAALDWIKTAFA